MKKIVWLLMFLASIPVGIQIMSCAKNPVAPGGRLFIPTSTPTATPTETPLPTPTAVLPLPSGTFQNFEAGNGTVLGVYFNNAWKCSANLVSVPVHNGTRALQAQFSSEIVDGQNHGGGTVGIEPMAPWVNLASATQLYLWVYDLGGNTIQIKLFDYYGNNQVVWTTGATPGTWTKVSAMLNTVSGLDLTLITRIELYEWNNGTYYFDDLGWE